MTKVLMAREATPYGATTLVSSSTREIRATNVPLKPTDRTDLVVLGGTQGGNHGIDSDDVYTVNKGGSMDLECAFRTNGLALFISSVLGLPVVTTPVGATNARLFTWKSATVPSTVHPRVAIEAEKRDGSVIQHRYGAGTGTQFDLMVQSGMGDNAPVKLKTSLDFGRNPGQDAYASMSGSFPAALGLFMNSMFSVQVFDAEDAEDSDACKSQNFTFSVKENLVLDYYGACANGVAGLPEEPYRSALPDVTGSMAWIYNADTYYDRLLAGEMMKVVATCDTGIEIEAGGETARWVLTLPKLQLTGDAPSAPAQGVATQDLPYVCRYDSALGYSWKLEHYTSDTSATTL